MRSSGRHSRVLGVLFLFTMLANVAVKADDLTNGGFESGYFRSWNLDNQAGFGSFIIATGTTAPVSQLPTAGSATGSYYAVNDQEGPGANALSQFFTISPGAPQVLLSFDMFVNDWSGAGPIVNPAGLNYTAFPNQHARVDILSADARPFDTGDGVLRNFYLSVDPGSNPHPYTHYEFDITDLVGGGGTFRIRFASVQTQFFLTMGVDNVAIRRGRETPTATAGSGTARPQQQP